MRIRGTKKPSCALCVFGKRSKLNESVLCTKTEQLFSEKDSCADFKYDIFKYKPALRLDFSKFSKEDFEI